MDSDGTVMKGKRPTFNMPHCKKSDFPFVKVQGDFVQSSVMVLVCNMAFAKSMIHILELMCSELLCTNVLLVGKIGKVLFST